LPKGSESGQEIIGPSQLDIHPVCNAGSDRVVVSFLPLLFHAITHFGEFDTSSVTLTFAVKVPKLYVILRVLATASDSSFCGFVIDAVVRSADRRTMGCFVVIGGQLVGKSQIFCPIESNGWHLCEFVGERDSGLYRLIKPPALVKVFERGIGPFC
jgi:hypothetical protein